MSDSSFQKSMNGGGSSNEPERKVFVGGLGWDVTDMDLHVFFRQFGDVKNVQIKFDPMTGRSRGFAFVEFASPDACQDALKTRRYEIKGKTVEVKRAVSRENKKIFVGGVSADMSEDSIKEYFATYGEVDEIELPVDKTTNRRRNFAFVIFVCEDSADAASQQQKHLLGDRYCDVKKATPNRPQLGQGGDESSGSGSFSQPNLANYGYGTSTTPGAGAAGGSSASNAYNEYYQAWYNYYYGGYGYNPNYGYGGGAPQPGNAGAPSGDSSQQGQQAYDWNQYYNYWQQYQQQYQQQQQLPGGAGQPTSGAPSTS